MIAEGAAGGEEGAVVQRRSAGNAANAVGAEELFGHEKRPEVRQKKQSSGAEKV
jgi:hypothetical protein